MPDKLTNEYLKDKIGTILEYCGEKWTITHYESENSYPVRVISINDLRNNGFDVNKSNLFTIISLKTNKCKICQRI